MTPELNAEKSKTLKSIAIAVPISAFVAVRLWNLTASCLWFDEIFTVHAAEHDWTSIFGFIAQDLIHPPLFYLLLKIWIAIGGEGLFWLRLLPVSFSVLAVFPFLGLCRELQSKTGAILISFLLFALNGSLIKYSQEVRMYSLLLCLSLFSIWLFTRYFRRGTGLALLIFINLVMIYSHYFGWFVVGAEFLGLILFKPERRKSAVLMCSVLAFAFLPWAIAVWRAASAGAEVGQNIGWMTKPGFGTIAQFLLVLGEPFYFSTSSAESASNYLISVPLFLAFFGTIFAYLFFQKQQRGQFSPNRILLLFIIVPIAAAFIISWVSPYSIWGTRHLIIVFAPFSILAGMSIDSMRLKPLKLAAISLFGIMCALTFTLEFTRQRTDYVWCAWEKLAEKVEPERPARIYAFEDLSAYHLWFALRKSSSVEVIKIDEIPGLTEDKAYFLPRGFDGVKRLKINEVGNENAYLAFRDAAYSELKPPVNIFLVNGYRLSVAADIEVPGTDVFLVKADK